MDPKGFTLDVGFLWISMDVYGFLWISGVHWCSGGISASLWADYLAMDPLPDRASLVQYPIGTTASQEQVLMVHIEPQKNLGKNPSGRGCCSELMYTYALCIPCLSPVDLCLFVCLAISQLDF